MALKMTSKKPVGWVNEPGLKLRAKSPIHAKIIDETTGRRRIDVTRDVEEWIQKIKQKIPEKWQENGTAIDIHRITRDVNQLKTFKKDNLMDVLVLGPSLGAEVIYLKEQFGEKSNIDTLGLSNNLSKEANAIKRKDYSPKVPSEKLAFEHFNHLHLIGKYDYIYSKWGPGYHTNHPEIVLLKAASMLRPGGIARIYIQDYMQERFNVIVDIKKYLELNKLNANVNFRYEEGYVVINRLK